MRVYGMPTMEILELFTGDEFQATKQKAEENIHKINRELVPNPEQFSEFYLSKTQAEFLQDVDEAIAACGITSDETEEINQKYTIGTNQEKESVKEDFWRIQIQVYQTLRKKGYSHWDVIH